MPGLARNSPRSLDARNYHEIVAGDKLILSHEGQHGKHGFILFDADPSKLTLYGNQEQKWVPPHASTTAYRWQPIVNPIVDSHIFFRGGNRIYCYT